MKKYIQNVPLLIIVILVLFFTTSCEKQLEVDPRQSIEASTALTSREAVEATITGVYAQLKNARQYGRDLITHPEALSDNGFATNKSGRLLGEAQNNTPTQAANHFTTTIWINSYAAINRINVTLEAIPGLKLTPAVSQIERNRWEGELYFLRALYYFDLVRVFGYIPGAVVTAQDKGGVVITTGGFSTAAAALAYKPSRAPIADVYKLINDDLVLANAKLLNPGLGSSRANKAAAQGLLARVNLYSRNYTDAKRWSDSCIGLTASRLTTTSNYVAQWRADTHTESLFQVRFGTSAENIGVNESLQTSFSTLVTVGNTAVTGGFGDLVPTLSLMSDLGISLGGSPTGANFLGYSAVISGRSTDVRNLVYEVGTAGRGPAKVECTKYLGKSGFINLDNVPVIRVSEIYLIRAEAQATTGSSVFNMANALTDLKTIKSRRYTDYTGSAQETADNAATQAVLFEEILRQRRIELAFEGHRFFDLKRLGRDLVKAPHYNNVAFTDTRILPPILQADVDGNPNLKQNTGY
jgi:starch-binding outer membrane protein, SusD/RagB family